MKILRKMEEKLNERLERNGKSFSSGAVNYLQNTMCALHQYEHNQR
jgi:hypothetical protein